MFPFTKCQEVARRETTGTFSVEVYRVSDSAIRAKWLHSLIPKASIN